MNAQERLRKAIEEEQGRLRRAVPRDQGSAIVAVLRQFDTLPPGTDREAAPDLITGQHIVDLGGSKALQLCLESSGAMGMASPPSAGWEGWAEGFLGKCGQLAEAEL